MRLKATLRFLVLAVGLTVVSATVPKHQPLLSCDIPHPAMIADAIERLQSDLRSGDAEAVADNYSSGAVLVGPNEAAVRIGRQEIASYFKPMLAAGLSVRTLTSALERDCATATVTGEQIFTGIPRSPAAKLHVDYKMIFARTETRWQLIHHNVAPRTSAAGDAAIQANGALQTASLLDGKQSIALPYPAFRLPETPPIILSAVRPQLVPPARKTVGVAVPPLNIRVGGFPLQASKAAPPQAQLPPQTHVPPPVAPNEIAIPQSFATAALPGIAPLIEPTTIAVPADHVTGPSPREPAVAAFIHRPSRTPTAGVLRRNRTAKTTGNPRRTAKPQADPVDIFEGYKPGRWVDGQPVYD